MTIHLTVAEHLANEHSKLYGRSVEYNGVHYILGEVGDNVASLYSSIAADQPDFIVDICLVTFI